MQINPVNSNNTSFGTLHIRPTATNKLALEKFYAKAPEAPAELLSEIDRESGNEDVYLSTSVFDGGNIDVAVIDKKGNLCAAKSVGLGSPENIKRSFEKFISRFTRRTLMPKPEMPKENKDVSAFLEQYK